MRSTGKADRQKKRDCRENETMEEKVEKRLGRMNVWVCQEALDPLHTCHGKPREGGTADERKRDQQENGGERRKRLRCVRK